MKKRILGWFNESGKKAVMNALWDYYEIYEWVIEQDLVIFECTDETMLQILSKINDLINREICIIKL